MSKGIIDSLLFDLKSFDYRVTFLVGIIVLLIYLLFIKLYKKQKFTRKRVVLGIVWSLYMALLLSGTLLNREVSDRYKMELELFWSYRVAFKNKSESMLWQIICNVIVFIPWGIMSAEIWDDMKKIGWNLYSAFVLSVMIEGAQLVFRCGLFEFDDIIHNVLGGAIGYGIWLLINKCRYKENHEK